MIRDAATAGLLPKQLLVTRLDAVIATAIAAYLEALDGTDKATASLNLLKVAQAASESWQQTVQGHNVSTITNPTISEIEQGSSASQDYDDDDPDLIFAPLRKSRPSAPQLG